MKNLIYICGINYKNQMKNNITYRQASSLIGHSPLWDLWGK